MVGHKHTRMVGYTKYIRSYGIIRRWGYRAPSHLKIDIDIRKPPILEVHDGTWLTFEHSSTFICWHNQWPDWCSPNFDRGALVDGYARVEYHWIMAAAAPRYPKQQKLHGASTAGGSEDSWRQPTEGTRMYLCIEEYVGVTNLPADLHIHTKSYKHVHGYGHTDRYSVQYTCILYIYIQLTIYSYYICIHIHI